MGTIDAFQRQVWSPQFKQNCFPHRSKMGVLKSFLHGAGRTVGAVEKGRRHVVVAGSAFSGTSTVPSTVPDGRVCCNRSVQGQEKGLPKVPSSGRRGFLPHSAFRKFARRIGTKPTVESASRRQASCDSESRVRFKARSSR